MERLDPYNSDEKTWAMICHLSALAYFIPFGQILGPLIVWVIKKDEYPLVDDQGKEALNFQLSILIYQLITIPLVFIVIGIPILIFLGVMNIVLVVVAGINAGRGVPFKYPLTIQLIR